MKNPVQDLNANENDSGMGCPTTGSAQGQVGSGFKQPDLVKDIPAHVGGQR